MLSSTPGAFSTTWIPSTISEVKYLDSFPGSGIGSSTHLVASDQVRISVPKYIQTSGFGWVSLLRKVNILTVVRSLSGTKARASAKVNC